jgi:uncharacterized membrane protein
MGVLAFFASRRAIRRYNYDHVLIGAAPLAPRPLPDRRQSAEETVIMPSLAVISCRSDARRAISGHFNSIVGDRP